MVKTVLPFCLFALMPYGAKAQQLSVKNQVIDCGNVIYEQPVTAKFEMQNRSSNPITIKDVKTSCGCTTVEYPKGQIAPGESFVVNATYDSRQMGHFFKDIALYSDATQQPFYLQIRGVVVEEIIDFAGQYPYTIVDLNVDRNDVEFDDVKERFLKERVARRDASAFLYAGSGFSYYVASRTARYNLPHPRLQESARLWPDADECLPGYVSWRQGAS